MHGRLPTAGERQGLPGFRRDLQAAQGAVIGAFWPTYHRGTTARTQALFGGPQGVGSARVDLEQPAQVDTRRLPGWRKRNEGR